MHSCSRCHSSVLTLCQSLPFNTHQHTNAHTSVPQVAVKVLESDCVLRREASTGLCLEALLGEKFKHPNIIRTLAWAVVTGKVRGWRGQSGEGTACSWIGLGIWGCFGSQLTYQRNEHCALF